MAYPSDVSDARWALLGPVLGRGSRGPRPASSRRTVLNAVLYRARTGRQRRYLPAEFGRWNTVWKVFCRWRDRGVWQEAVDVLRRTLRAREGRDPEPSMVMLDCQVTKGGRGGPSFHETHGKYRLCGAKRTIAIDYLGLPVGATVHGARRHDVRAARDLLDELLPNHPRVADVLGDCGFRDNWAREQAAVLVAGYGVLAVEGLELGNMTRSARGTVEEPGSNVAAKQGLNRELQDAALGKPATRI